MVVVVGGEGLTVVVLSGCQVVALISVALRANGLRFQNTKLTTRMSQLWVSGELLPHMVDVLGN